MASKSKRPVQCQVCLEQQFKYTCPQCHIIYCSLSCYKKHKEESCTLNKDLSSKSPNNESPQGLIREPKEPTPDEPLDDPLVLRPLTSLKWPYVPEESAFPDPLKRDDPKVIQLHQYEAIATSPAIRKILEEHKELPDLLTSIDRLRGREREEVLQATLGVTATGLNDQPTEEVLALRALAEAVEAAIRGKNETALGLNWGD